MEQQTQSLERIRQRKFLMVLPLLALPFLTFLFWSLGGGKMEEVGAGEALAGLNFRLPEVTLKDEKILSKMDYYDQAQADSTKFRALINSDPNYQVTTFESIHEEEGHQEDDFFDGDRTEAQGINASIIAGTGYNDPNEERVYQKLAQLDKALKKIDGPNQDDVQRVGLTVQKNNPAFQSEDIDRLERMMQAMNSSDGEDEEIRQLNGMLERILDIQHPDRVEEKLKQTSLERKGQLFAVAKADNPLFVSSLAGGSYETEQANGFYSWDEPTQTTEAQNAVQAVIHETQTLVNGSTVKLRLLDEVYIDGRLIPKNHFLFGVASLNGERLLIKIKSIQYQKSLFPVDLSVYDIDGLNGIYIPGAIGRDVVKESANRSIQSLGLASLDPSLEAQATSAGIEAARNLFSRKIKRVKVTVKAGYHVLLKDEKQQ